MTPAEANDARRAPRRAMAPLFPLQLVEPVAIARGDAEDATDVTWGIEAIGAASSPFTGAGIKVAVLDTGIDRNHEAFRGLNVTEMDFTGAGNGDSNGHGTHCAGTIAGRELEGRRIGVAPGIDELLVGKVLAPGGSTHSLIDALFWALKSGAHVLSLSLRIDFPGLVERLTSEGLEIQPATSQALDAYRQNLQLFETLAGVLRMAGQALIVAATGNESRRAAPRPYSIVVAPPASSPGIVPVAAVTRRPEGGFDVAEFSNTGAALAAPGVKILSARAGGGTNSMDGTSMATPHVAGAAALWAERRMPENGRLDQALLTTRLLGSTAELPGLDYVDVRVGIVSAPQSAKPA